MLISVLIANYNHGHFLEARIRSILDQLPQNGELILVDDASTDGSQEIIKKYAKKDPRLRISFHKTNEGANKAMMKAYSLSSKGKYLCLLSVDDLVAPEFLQKNIAMLEGNSNIPFCCSDCGYFFDKYKIKSRPILMTFRLLKEKNSLVCSAEKALVLIRDYNFWIPGHTAVIRRESFEKGGGVNHKFGPKSDWFLYHSIALESGFGYIPETLAYWRAVSSSYTSQLADSVKRESWKEEVMKVLSQKPELLRKFQDSLLLDRRF